ncbi:MAG: hypothetical protein ABIW57_14410 [Polyangia bacterium]
MPLAWPPLLALFLVPSLEVRGTTQCPSPEEVLAQLKPLLSDETALPPTDWLELRDVSSTAAAPAPPTAELEVRLARAGAKQPLGVRRLRRTASCADMAEAVAVVAASWIGQYPTMPAMLPALPPPAAVQESTTSAPGSPVVSSQSSAIPRAAPGPWALGAGGGIVLTTGTTAAAHLQVELERVLRGSWSLRLTAAGAGARTVELGAGEVAWRRFLLFPAVSFAWRTPSVYVEGAGGLAAALVRSEGRGFPSNQTDTTFDWGLCPSVRVGSRLGRELVSVWAGVNGLFWLRAPVASVDAPATGGQAFTVTLPRWDLAIAGGVTFRLGS